MSRGAPTGPVTAELYREVLEAVAEAIDLPDGATADDEEIRDEILGQRADRAAYAVQTVLRYSHDAEIVHGAMVMLKRNLGGNPYKDQYRTWVEAYGSHPLEGTR
jgi:hypothetical protein